MSAPFSLQKKIQELEAIEAYFQQPDIDLEMAIEKHKKALALAKEITTYLDSAESSLRQIDMHGQDGSTSNADAS